MWMLDENDMMKSNRIIPNNSCAKLVYVSSVLPLQLASAMHNTRHLFHERRTSDNSEIQFSLQYICIFHSVQ
jgi:hypothetical protein